MIDKERKSVAEVYEVKPSYKRFDQRYNMTRQPLWNPPMIELRNQRTENLKCFVEEGRHGYALIDFAFNMGAEGNLINTGFSLNQPNCQGNSWLPLRTRIVNKRWEGDSSQASNIIGKVARLYGADQVGFCELDRRWVYSHYYDETTKKSFPIKFSDEAEYEEYDKPTQLEDGTQIIPKEMKYVIVLIFEMDAEGISTAPTLTQMATTNVAYSRISFTTIMVAEFLRGLGYHAIPSSNCTALSIPLAIEAGLGQLGRNGQLITPQSGPRCRISKVITDLPLESGKPRNFGVTEFCSTCKRCAERCPAQAIPYGRRSFKPVNECNNGGVLAWYLDHKKCYQYWSKVGTSCGICIAVCPYNEGFVKYDGRQCKSFWNH